MATLLYVWILINNVFSISQIYLYRFLLFLFTAVLEQSLIVEGKRSRRTIQRLDVSVSVTVKEAPKADLTQVIKYTFLLYIFI